MLSTRTTLLGVLLLMTAAVLGWLAVGRGDGVGLCHPVEGTVLLKSKPLQGQSGRVMFVPDQAKGNRTPLNPQGEIDKEGHYKLVTKGRAGAPAGWYKVVVSAFPPGTGDRDDPKRPLIHGRYTAESTTPLSIEVVASPAPCAYDLPTTRN